MLQAAKSDILQDRTLAFRLHQQQVQLFERASSALLTACMCLVSLSSSCERAQPNRPSSFRAMCCPSWSTIHPARQSSVRCLASSCTRTSTQPCSGDRNGMSKKKTLNYTLIDSCKIKRSMARRAELATTVHSRLMASFGVAEPTFALMIRYLFIPFGTSYKQEQTNRYLCSIHNIYHIMNGVTPLYDEVDRFLLVPHPDEDYFPSMHEYQEAEPLTR